MAYAVPGRKLFENMYVGWGIKYLSENHTPASVGEQQVEFVPSESLSVSEASDPTPEQERALDEARKRAEAEVEEHMADDELDGGPGDEGLEPPGLPLEEPDD